MTHRLRRAAVALLVIGVAGLSSFLNGCAHVEKAEGLRAKIDADSLLAQTCSIGRSVSEAKGVVLMKVKSREASGQLNGDVRAQAPDTVELEILQPLGGVWATIRVQGPNYSVDVSGKPDQGRKGHRVWAGIPLRFATDLFLGRIPCPPTGSRADAQINSENELVVKGGGPNSSGTFIYRFRVHEGSFWPESLHWELGLQGDGPVAVDFKFDEPEAVTRSPLRWEAHSDRGEIKLHWRHRDHT
ncbi:MAG: hypothetical protein P4M08_04820 [Oligoflexia bacterium]|nr:hypothetical protein [Oligoflexia bacterium]